jgi:integrase
MANLGTKNGVFLARFRFRGKEYKRSLQTSDRRAAEGAMHRVEDALHRLAINTLAVPDGVDPGDFILCGGTLAAPVKTTPPCPVPTLEMAIKEYLGNLAHLAESHRYTISVHLRNLTRKLGDKVGRSVGDVARKDLEEFLQARLKERSRTTVSKERATIQQFFRWAQTRDYLIASPADGLTAVKTEGNLPSRFRTVEEVEAVIARGGMTREQEWSLWDWLFLTPAEIAEILATVRERAQRGVSFILHAVAAYTAMRRSEVLRLRWIDVALGHDTLVARSRKQSRQEAETQRQIDLHPELATILRGWQAKRPKGQYVVCDDGSLTPLTPRTANSRFWQPLRGTKWCLCSHKNRFKVGFHTYRHSFASNLAALGVDQRVIDEFMGHQTEAMRKRYRHLFPRNRRSAIESFSLVPAVRTGYPNPDDPVGGVPAGRVEGSADG